MVEPTSAGGMPLRLSGAMRRERDLLGELDVPADAYYGIQTLRAVQMYDITGVRLRHFPEFVVALAQVKKACARSNHKLGHMTDEVTKAICQACDEIIHPAKSEAGVGKVLRDSFVVDMVQGGAGTSTNMNANEVIANRALELMGKAKGDYQYCHPNDHVNKSQSTNDAYPTAAKIAIHHMHHELVRATGSLRDAFRAKAQEFHDVLKMGRTQLQDAVPMTLGQEFEAYAVTINSDFKILTEAALHFCDSNLGGTAIGTGIAADPDFPAVAVQELREVTGLPMLLADNLIEASSSVGSMILFSGVLRRIAIKISKVCNDLRLLSSGPRCGFGEINLPPMAPGSSIMPGKVNPVIPEVMGMACFQTIGLDNTVVMGAEAGQLELNVFEPVIIFSLFMQIQVLTRGMDTLRTRCIDGITANVERCADLVHNSIGIVTALLPHIGYKKSSEAAKLALRDKRSVADVVVELGYLKRDEVKEALRIEAMVGSGGTLTKHPSIRAKL